MIELRAPSRPIHANIALSGSKSLSNRWLIIGQVLKTQFIFNGLSDSDDTQILREALKKINTQAASLIDVGQAGTCMRFLCACLAITEGSWILTGSGRIKERPISELVSALQQLGADIHYLEKQNYPPLAIKGRALEGGKITIDGGISSQFVSALLLVAPSFKNGLSLSISGKLVSQPYVGMTVDLLKQSGVKVISSSDLIKVEDVTPKKAPVQINVESDWSSASYHYSICALSKDCVIKLSHFEKKSIQGDSILPQLYETLGVKTEFKSACLEISSHKVSTTFFDFDFSDCPDLAQTVAVTCFGLGIEARLRGLKTLKFKETDRIAALKTELQKFGAIVEAGTDYLHIAAQKPNPSPDRPHSGQIAVNTYNDHRMAMCFAPLAIKYKTLFIHDHTVVNKSYPSFWEHLISLGFSVNLQP